MVLIVFAGMSPKVGLALTGSILIGCLGFALAVRVLTGNERLVFYHYLFVGSFAALRHVVARQRPTPPYLDIVACLVAVLTGFGRIGCLLAGCCHGRPWRHGVIYTAAHAADGFPSQFVGIRLLPVQAMESAWGFVVALVCSAVVLWADTPGMALALFGVAQPGGRFVLEFLRGDEREPELRRPDGRAMDRGGHGADHAGDRAAVAAASGDRHAAGDRGLGAASRRHAARALARLRGDRRGLACARHGRRASRPQVTSRGLCASRAARLTEACTTRCRQCARRCRPA